LKNQEIVCVKNISDNCEDVLSSQLSQFSSKRDVDVAIVVVDVHHTLSSHLDDSFEGMPSLFYTSPIA